MRGRRPRAPGRIPFPPSTNEDPLTAAAKPTGRSLWSGSRTNGLFSYLVPRTTATRPFARQTIGMRMCKRDGVPGKTLQQRTRQRPHIPTFSVVPNTRSNRDWPSRKPNTTHLSLHLMISTNETPTSYLHHTREENTTCQLKVSAQIPPLVTYTDDAVPSANLPEEAHLLHPLLHLDRCD